jgi:hydrogenase nickel incorporation protein HypB
MTIEVLRKSIFAKNDQAAEQNRSLLREHDVVAVNIMGGAGCGKTTLLERIIPQLRNTISTAVLEGDLATTKDAARIAELDVPVVQLLTEGGCHLTATLVQQGLGRLPLDTVDLVFIENVGNPICPANFDLGEHYRMAILSVTEGDDKPAKYPYLFSAADLVVLTKMDLLAATDFDCARASADIHALDSQKTIISTAANDESTIRPVAEWLASKCRSSTEAL